MHTVSTDAYRRGRGKAFISLLICLLVLVLSFHLPFSFLCLSLSHILCVLLYPSFSASFFYLCLFLLLFLYLSISLILSVPLCIPLYPFLSFTKSSSAGVAWLRPPLEAICLLVLCLWCAAQGRCNLLKARLLKQRVIVEECGSGPAQRCMCAAVFWSNVKSSPPLSAP